jgi:hypothetical protein
MRASLDWHPDSDRGRVLARAQWAWPIQGRCGRCGGEPNADARDARSSRPWTRAVVATVRCCEMDCSLDPGHAHVIPTGGCGVVSEAGTGHLHNGLAMQERARPARVNHKWRSPRIPRASRVPVEIKRNGPARTSVSLLRPVGRYAQLRFSIEAPGVSGTAGRETDAPLGKPASQPASRRVRSRCSRATTTR